MKTSSLFLGLAIGMLGAMPAQAAERWDMPTGYAAANFHTQTAVLFGEAVEQATGGKIKIVVHPGGSLFKAGEIKRAVQTGQAPIGERLVSALANENPLFGVDAVPFLATSYEASWRLYQASKAQLVHLLDSQNLVFLYATPWPPQGLYANKAVNSVADMKGMKFRSYNPVMARLAELMGAVPTQIEEAELSQALATGIANSLITSGATGVERKVWEQLSHFYDLQAWLPKNMVFVNKRVWNGLDAETRATIRGAAAMAEAVGWARSKELSAQYLKILADNGMAVAAPSPELKAGVDGIGEAMTKEWLTQAGDAGAAILQGYRHGM